MDFIEKIKDLTLEKDEDLISLEAEALYPSLPLAKCIDIIHQRLQNDPSLSNRTLLTADDITELVRLCFSTSNFIYDGIHHTAEDSGPVGLILMTDIANIWMDHTLQEATKIAVGKGISVPRNMCVYVDDIFGIQKQNATKTAHIEFASCLSQVDPRLKFTHEIEEKKSEKNRGPRRNFYPLATVAG